MEVNARQASCLYPEGAAAIGYPFKRLVHTLVAQAYLRGIS